MTCESVLLWLVRQRIRVNWLKNWRSRFKTMTIFLHSYSTIWYSAGVVTSDIALTAIRILNFLALLNISVFKIRVTLREPNYRYGLVAVCSVRICTTHINACPWFQPRWRTVPQQTASFMRRTLSTYQPPETTGAVIAVNTLDDPRGINEQFILCQRANQPLVSVTSFYTT